MGCWLGEGLALGMTVTCVGVVGRGGRKGWKEGKGATWEGPEEEGTKSEV